MSNELRINYWWLYKVSVDVSRQFVILNVHILSAFNVYMSKTSIKESLNADWISIKLKEEITVVLTVKLIFI